MSTDSSPTPGSGPVTMLVTRRIKPGQEARFLALMDQMLAAARAFPGHLGGQIIQPDGSEGSEPGLFHVLFAFDTPAHLEAWQQSPARALGLSAIEPATAGPAQTRELIGMAHWFMTGHTPSPPPRWKVALMSWLGIFPTVLVLNAVLGSLMAEWPVVPRTLLFTGLVVLLMTWVVAPQLTRWLKPWLHRPGAP